MTHKQLKKLKAKVENTLAQMQLAPRKIVSYSQPQHLTNKTVSIITGMPILDTERVISKIYDTHQSSAPGHNHF